MPDPQADTRAAMIQALIEFFSQEGITIHGARSTPGLHPPTAIPNPGFGSARTHTPDVVGLDQKRHRIAFGIVRPDKQSLDSELSLEEYNVFLDHNAQLGERASVLYVGMEPSLIAEFLPMIMHYIHRDYWHRIVPVAIELPLEGK